MANLQARKPSDVAEAGRYEPVKVMAVMARDDKVESTVRRIRDHLSQRRLQMVRITDAKHLGTIECIEIERMIGSAGVCPHDDQVKIGGNTLRDQCRLE